MNKIFFLLFLTIFTSIFSQGLDTTSFSNNRISIPMVNNGNIGGVLKSIS